MVYFVYSSFIPDNASNNRARAYLKALSTLCFPVKVLFLIPDARRSRLHEELPGISVEYCWDKHYKNGRLGKLLSYLRYIRELFHRLHPGDIVYLYGEVDLMMILSFKKGIHLFHERTEHPLVYPPKGRLFKPSLKKYLRFCKKLDGLFVISTCLRDFFIENGIPADRIQIVHPIVDTTRFDGLAKQDCEPYFAYCGNGNNKKDKVDELLRVFARVASHHKDIQFYVIGPTKQVYEDEQDNVELVHQLGLDNRVVFTGQKPAEEIPQLLVNAVALFLTRPDTLQNRAGFSTKLGEYLASGNPVVAAGVGDIPLYLHDKENAFVFVPGDFDAVGEAMEYILMHPEESRQIGIAGKETAHRYFNALEEAKKLINAFEKES